MLNFSIYHILWLLQATFDIYTATLTIFRVYVAFRLAIYPGRVYNPKHGQRSFIMSETTNCCGGERKTMRSEEAKKSLMARLKRAEGQIRGIEKMLEEDAYCPDILIQVSAVSSALNSFNKELMASHIKHCVSEDIKAGNDESVTEFVKIMQKLMK